VLEALGNEIEGLLLACGERLSHERSPWRCPLACRPRWRVRKTRLLTLNISTEAEATGQAIEQ